jgi:hypothetical protein
MSKPRRQAQARGTASRLRFPLAVAAVVAAGVAAGILIRSSRSTEGTNGPVAFKQVGRNGPVFTVSVPRARAEDEDYLMSIAQQISDEEKKTGASGQVSVMVWPDDVQVPTEPPTNEFDASMKTQAAGIFLNPAMNIKHMIRFKNGNTVAERDFGKPTQ